MIFKNGKNRVWLSGFSVMFSCAICALAIAQNQNPSATPGGLLPPAGITNTVTAPPASASQSYPNQVKVNSNIEFWGYISNCNQLGDKIIQFSPNDKINFRIQSTKTAFCRLTATLSQGQGKTQTNICDFSKDQLAGMLTPEAIAALKRFDEKHDNTDEILKLTKPFVDCLTNGAAIKMKNNAPSNSSPAISPNQNTSAPEYKVYDYSKVIH